MLEEQVGAGDLAELWVVLGLGVLDGTADAVCCR
jgi:hypothetical protein